MSSGAKYMPRRPRCVEIPHFSHNTLVDLVAVYLQGISVVANCDEITDIEFGPKSCGVVPLKIYIKKGGKN